VMWRTEFFCTVIKNCVNHNTIVFYSCAGLSRGSPDFANHVELHKKQLFIMNIIGQGKFIVKKSQSVVCCNSPRICGRLKQPNVKNKDIYRKIRESKRGHEHI
ncbi:MAG: hypothetical protein C0392_14075, partial [Syntrophus sp. (in: bacteria)]|nr:hypothetical protein [Syntrophus sp. (in: bacteria)]